MEKAEACAIGDVSSVSFHFANYMRLSSCYFFSLQPLDEKTSFGPLVRSPSPFRKSLSARTKAFPFALEKISSAQRDKVLAYIDSGVSQGATLSTGGKKWTQSAGGFYVEPTVLSNCQPSFQCVQEEIFGPVLTVMKFKTEEEAVEMANDSIYGLAAAVFTSQSQICLFFFLDSVSMLLTQ